MITAEQKAHFDTFGFIHLPQQFSLEEMEGIANFTEEGYKANFSTYTSAVGIKLTRRKSASIARDS